MFKSIISVRVGCKVYLSRNYSSENVFSCSRVLVNMTCDLILIIFPFAKHKCVWLRIPFPWSVFSFFLCFLLFVPLRTHARFKNLPLGSVWLFNWKQRGICKIFLLTQPHENSINVYERTVILLGNRCIGSNLRKRALTQIKNHFWLVTDLSWLLKGYSTDMVIIFTKFSVLYGVTFEIYSRASFIY